MSGFPSAAYPRCGWQTAAPLLAELVYQSGWWVGLLNSTGQPLASSGVGSTSDLRLAMFVLPFASPLIPGVGMSDSIVAKLGSHRRGLPSCPPQLLQLDVPCSQEVQQFEACVRPQHPQQAHAVTSLLDGNSSLHYALLDPQTLGDLHQPWGCLLSHPDHRIHRHYVRFWFKHHLFYFWALPVGLATSLYLFTWQVKAVSTFVSA